MGAPTVAVKTRPQTGPVTHMPDLTGDDDATADLLRRSRRIAVYGASADPMRTSNDIFGYLLGAGYELLPVTPKVEPVHGVEPVPDLAAAAATWARDGGIDIVNVFRRKAFTPEVAQQAVAAHAKAIWFQLDTDHPDAVRAALEAGLDVIADECIKVEHRRLVH